jgi:hypothetical protein
MYVAVGAVSFYGLLLTQGHADDLLEDVGQDVRGCTLTETQKSEALTSHVRGDVRADVNASQKPSNKEGARAHEGQANGGCDDA